MKKILIITDNILAKEFLERILKLKTLIIEYEIICQNDEVLSENLLKASNFKIHNFDPTSFEKLKSILIKSEFDRIFTIMSTKNDTLAVYKNIREIYEKLEIYIFDLWTLSKEIQKDEFLKIIDVNGICSSRLVNFLPNSPAFADSIGLGKGEIMEVKVPIGSSFAYKKVGLLAQKNYKIPMIYRYNNFLVTNNNTMILPNDSLLVVGEPSVLRSVFSMIYEQGGQFPSPFGINICLLADMKKINRASLEKLIRVGESLDKVLNNHKIYIKILNPTICPVLDEIKKLGQNPNFEVLFDYTNKGIKSLQDDVKQYKIGLVVVDRIIFRKCKKNLYELNTPVMSIGKCEFDEIQKGVVLISNHQVTEESTSVFDICSQFDLDLYLYRFEKNQDSDEVLSHFKNLSKLFNKELHISDNNAKNPLVYLKNEHKMIQFIPFNESVLKSGIFSNFSKNLDELYYKLDENYQLFIPSDYKFSQNQD